MPNSDNFTVHPHVCGEHRPMGHQPFFRCGSSPRVWGTPAIWSSVPDQMRFIPTCVGNTGLVYNTGSLTAVHPHVCGEHSKWFVEIPFPIGSSPRVWGTHSAIRYAPEIPRFIPTCVGNTSVILRVANTIAVHPHVCGEHERVKCLLQKSGGSSPRVWGTPSGTLSCGGQTRFIPTCVGNTK